MNEEEDYIVSWEFTDIFKSNDSRIACVIDVLEAFESFPPDTRLNCDDYYSLFSVVCENIPYPFIVFVCECVDPSISSGTLMSHRIAFGNFLLAFPCCILFPQFVHKLLTLFKTADRLRTGVITRTLFLSILKDTFSSFIQTLTLKGSAGEEEEDDDEEETQKERITTIDPRRLPDFSMITEVQRATTGLDEASVQTLLFVMWQKDPTLLRCKARIKPENFQAFQQASKVDKADDDVSSVQSSQASQAQEAQKQAHDEEEEENQADGGDEGGDEGDDEGENERNSSREVGAHGNDEKGDEEEANDVPKPKSAHSSRQNTPLNEEGTASKGSFEQEEQNIDSPPPIARGGRSIIDEEVEAPEISRNYGKDEEADEEFDEEEEGINSAADDGYDNNDDDGTTAASDGGNGDGDN